MAVTIIAYVFCITKKSVTRPEGVTLSIAYAAYLAYAIIR